MINEKPTIYNAPGVYNFGGGGGGGGIIKKVVIIPPSTKAYIIDSLGNIGQEIINDGTNVFAFENEGAEYTGNTIEIVKPVLSTVEIDGINYKTTICNGKEFICDNLKNTFDFDIIFNDTTNVAQCCYWHNDINNIGYGVLYNGWAAAEIDNKLNNGWHVARRDDWDAIVSKVGGRNNGPIYFYAKNTWNNNENYKTDVYEMNINPYGYAYGAEWAGGDIGFKGFGINNTWWDTSLDTGGNQLFQNAVSSMLLASSSYEPRTNYFYVRICRDVI